MKFVTGKEQLERVLRGAPTTSMVSNSFRVPFSGDVWYRFKWGTHRVIMIARPLNRFNNPTARETYVVLPVDILEMTAEESWHNDSWDIHGKSELSRDYIRLIRCQDHPHRSEWRRLLANTDIRKWDGQGDPPKCKVEGIGDWALLAVQCMQITPQDPAVRLLVQDTMNQYDFLLSQAQAI